MYVCMRVNRDRNRVAPHLQGGGGGGLFSEPPPLSGGPPSHPPAAHGFGGGGGCGGGKGGTSNDRPLSKAAEAVIKRSLLVGNFEAAVQCCMSTGNMADAMLLARCVGGWCWMLYSRCCWVLYSMCCWVLYSMRCWVLYSSMCCWVVLGVVQ